METESRTQQNSFWSKPKKIIITSVVALIAATTVAVSINSSKAQTKSETDTRTPHTQSAIAKNNSQIIQTISSQKAAEAAAIESSKIAEQKAAEEAQATAKQQAEESAKAAQASSQAASTQTNNVSKVEPSNPAPSNNANATNSNANNTQPSQVASTDTSGFNFAGHHFPIASFAGTGQVPANNYVYQWASDSRWFLIEQGGAAGHIIKSYIHMGTPVTVNGRTYHVTDLVGGIRNDGTASAYYQQHIGQHAIGFQTCDSPGVLTLYFAD